MTGRRRAPEPERIVVGLSWAAAELGFGIDATRRLARRGEIPGAFQIGGRWRVSVPAFRRAIARIGESTPELPLDWGQDGAQAPRERLAEAGAPNGRRGGSKGSDQRITVTRGQAIAAEAPRARREANRPAAHADRIVSITGDAPSLVRRRRPSNPQDSPK